MVDDGKSGTSGRAQAAEPGDVRALRAELAKVRQQLREAHETIETIRSGGAEARAAAALEALREQHAFLKRAQETVGLAWWRSDLRPPARMTASPGLLTIFGLTAEQFGGDSATFWARIHPEDRPRIAEQALDAVTDADAMFQDEYRVLRPDGSIRWVVESAIVERDETGAAIRVLGIGQDITDRKQIEEEARASERKIRALNAELEARVQQRTAELVRANKNLEAFSYCIAHDLRAPLRAMSGYSEALLEDCGELLDETGRGYAATIQAAGDRMALLIDALLHLSRVSRAEITTTTMDLSAEATAIAAELQSAEPGRRVCFRIQPGVLAAGDRALIRTVMQNLLENAWKFTAKRDDATIEFGAAAEGGKIRCHVRDNGAGFDPDHANVLFQPFQRLHAASEFPGTGIGLASVRQVIERHGGEVWAEGTPGQGATFYLTLDLPT